MNWKRWIKKAIHISIALCVATVLFWFMPEVVVRVVSAVTYCIGIVWVSCLVASVIHERIEKQ